MCMSVYLSITYRMMTGERKTNKKIHNKTQGENQLKSNFDVESHFKQRKVILVEKSNFAIEKYNLFLEKKKLFIKRKITFLSSKLL